MTDGIMEVQREWTGSMPVTCPWRAYSDPFVTRTMMAYPHWRRGQLALIEPDAPHRLVQAITLYDHVLGVCAEKRREQEAKQRS